MESFHHVWQAMLKTLWNGLVEWWAISLQVSHWTQQHISGHLKNPKCQLEKNPGVKQPPNHEVSRVRINQELRNKEGFEQKQKKRKRSEVPVNKCWMLCLPPGGWTALCYNTGDKQQVTPLTRAHLSPAQWEKSYLTAAHTKLPTAAS